MTDADLREAFDPDKPVSLPNRKCAYCGAELERRTVARKSKGAFSQAKRRLAAHSYNKIDASIPIGGGRLDDL